MNMVGYSIKFIISRKLQGIPFEIADERISEIGPPKDTNGGAHRKSI